MAVLPTDQKWYHLGTILSIPFSLPMIIVGHKLAKIHGAGVSICSILVGNLILWLIGLAVISMASEERSNAIDNVKSYLGTFGAVLMWIVMMVSILNWFALQLDANMPSIGEFLKITNHKSLIWVGTGIGIITTLIALGGIQNLKWMTITASPLVILYYLVAIFRSEYSISNATSVGLSISAIISTVLVLLPGVINLPTLFRHTQSKADSYLGLSILFFLISFFEIATIWMNFNEIGIVYEGVGPFAIATFLFLLFTLISINFINIYYSSALCESYIPRLAGAKGYLIFGLLGTFFYTFVKAYTSIQVLANLTNSFLASLGIVLLIAYLIRMIIRHRPRKFEQGLNSLCWVIGCAVSAIFVAYDIEDYVKPLLMGLIASASSFLVIIFIEENIWATKKVLSYKD